MKLLQRTDQTWKAWLFAAMLVLGIVESLLRGFLHESLGKEVAI